jgi:hypothetical protein
MKKSAPPGWSPSQITHRIDGFVVDPENPDRVPSRVASLIHAAEFGGDSISDVRARMVARQNAHEHRRKRQRAIINRMAKVQRHA